MVTLSKEFAEAIPDEHILIAVKEHSRFMASAPHTNDPAASPLRRARLAVAAFFVIHGLIFASWIVRIPDMKAQLHLSDGQLGLALLGAPAGVLGGQFLVGWLLPRWGSRRIGTI